ncbi:MAG: hypothetical protein ABID54_11090 [Pseudomonadota bacterium]
MDRAVDKGRKPILFNGSTKLGKPPEQEKREKDYHFKEWAEISHLENIVAVAGVLLP